MRLELVDYIECDKSYEDYYVFLDGMGIGGFWKESEKGIWKFKIVGVTGIHRLSTNKTKALKSVLSILEG